MSEKINIAELLKDCPSGMELDCTMYDNLFFDSLNADYYGTINCYTLIDGIKTSINFTKYGTFNNHAGAKCVIFPKDKTTWEGFVPPRRFKDGDVVATMDGFWIGITTGGKIGKFIPTYCVIQYDDKFEAYLDRKESWVFNRLATEEEKEKLFQTIKDNGYYWNAETKTLERLIEPKFKVGDEIKYKNGKNIDGVEQGVILSITDEVYDVAVTNNMGVYVSIAEQDNWELVSNKFDINTLVPFESRVLVRDNKLQKWHPAMWGYYDCDSQDYPYKLVGCVSHYRISYEGNDAARYCIPYEGNEHLLGTTNDCDEYYKTW